MDSSCAGGRYPLISFLVAARLAICNTVLNCLCICPYCLIYSFPAIGCPYGGAARGARL